MLPPNPNTKTARQLLTELQPGKYVTMYDPKNPSFMMTQCARVGNTYYLAGPQFTVFTNQLPMPAEMRPKDGWELQGLFDAARSEGDSEAEIVQLTNLFCRAHGAQPQALIFTCLSLDDTLATLRGLYASFKR